MSPSKEQDGVSSFLQEGARLRRELGYLDTAWEKVIGTTWAAANCFFPELGAPLSRLQGAAMLMI